MRPAVERRTPPPYPGTTRVLDYAEDYRVNHFLKTGDPKGFYLYEHNRYIDVLVCGGLNNYFVIYAYSPAGFWYAGLEELELIEPWRGWILQYHPQTQSYKTLINTKNDGYGPFEALKTAIGI